MAIVAKKTVPSHDVLKTKDGRFVLVFDALSSDKQKEPVLLVSGKEPVAYLRRSLGEVYEIPEINATNIDTLRKSESIVVVEMKGEQAVHSYAAIAAILEDDEP